MPPSSLIPPEAPTIPLEEFSGEAEQPPITVSAAPPVEIGDNLAARYHLLELIGEGGMGRVYKAIDVRREHEGRDDAVIAVKVMKGTFDEPAGRFSALCAHVHQWRRLLHPNIGQLIDCERDGSAVFITMEYVAGETAYAKLHKRAAAPGSRAPRDGEEARLIITAVSDAIEYAHQQGIVHGDIKPGNIIVTERGEVKVIDFGIARWLGAAATPSYASPQVLAGREPGRSDDVFSLSCLAYELLTGVHPFAGAPDADSRSSSPPMRPGIVAHEYAALLHGMSPEVGKRTASAREFAAELGAPARPRLPGRWPLWAAAAALVAVGWMLFRPSHKPAPRLPTVAETPQAPSAGAPAADKPGTMLRDCPTCPAMIVLPPGQFQQGSAADDRDALPFEKPRHLVRIGYPLAMSTTDVTVDDFGQFIAAMGRDMQGCFIYDGEWRHRTMASWKDPGFSQKGNHPATCVSWNDAVAYAEWLSGKTGHHYRLPSASEWEYAARAGGESIRPWDANGEQACANANVADQSAERRYPGWIVFPCNDGYVNTAPVGSFTANALGLSDMLGNVFEWTQDCWQADYAQAPTDGSAREAHDCRDHELRGGSWFSAPATVKATYRNHFAADYRTSSVGFRVVRDID